MEIPIDDAAQCPCCGGGGEVNVQHGPACKAEIERLTRERDVALEDMKRCQVKDVVATRAAKMFAEKRERAEARVAEQDAEIETLKATIEPVRSWYDGDGELTDVAAMLTAAVADLQDDRASVLKAEARIAKLEKTLRFILRVDKTPMYGYAGRDADRDRHNRLPGKAGQRWKTPRELVRDLKLPAEKG